MATKKPGKSLREEICDAPRGSKEIAKKLIEIYEDDYPAELLVSNGPLTDYAFADPCSWQGQETVFIKALLDALCLIEHAEARKIAKNINRVAGKRMRSWSKQRLEKWNPRKVRK